MQIRTVIGARTYLNWRAHKPAIFSAKSGLRQSNKKSLRHSWNELYLMRYIVRLFRVLVSVFAALGHKDGQFNVAIR